MTSKRSSTDNFTGNSFIKDQLMLTHTRTWVVALTILAAILHYILIPGVALMGYRMQLDLASADAHESLVKAASMWFGYDGIGNLFGVSSLAIVIAIQGFSYLYNLRSVDFFDSHPISYKKQFFNRYVNGIIIYAIIHFAGIFFGMALCGLCDAISFNLAGIMVLEYFRGLAAFIGLYSVFVLAAVLSGNIFIAFLLGNFFSAVEAVIKLIYFVCKSEYYATFSDTIDTFSDIHILSSPLYYYYFGFGGSGSFTDFFTTNSETMMNVSKALSHSIGGCIATLVLAILATGLAFAAFSQRPRETAGKGLCFPVMESVVKIVIAGCVGMLSMMMVDGIFESRNRYTALMFIVMIISVTLTCMVGEVIFAANVTSATKRFWHIPAIIAGCIIIIISFKQDLFGYDSFVPEVGDVESAVFYPNDYQSYDRITPVDEKTGMSDSEYCIKYMKLTDIEAVEALARIGMDYRRRATLHTSVSNDFINHQESADSESFDGWSCTVHYRMKSGKIISRNLLIPYDTDADVLDAVVGSDEYKEAYYDAGMLLEEVPKLKEKYGGKISVFYDYFSSSSDSRNLNNAQFAALMSAYEKDVAKNYNYSFATGTNVIGAFDLSFHDIDHKWLTDSAKYRDVQSQRFVVYEGYENTIAELKKLSIYEDCLPKISDIKSVAVSYYLADEMEFLQNDGDEAEYETTQLIYSKKDEIKDILKNARFDYGTANWQKDVPRKGDFYQVEASTFIIRDYEEIAEIEGSFTYELDIKDAPKFLKKDFDKAMKK